MSHWCRNIPRDEAVRASEDNRQGPLPTLEEAIAGVTERRPFQPGGGGNVTGGLRTERVTLEITHDATDTAAEWPWKNILAGDDVWGFWPDKGESVRVVEEAHFDDLAQVAMERDAAIRERDTLRAERITQALTADRFAAAVQEADRLRARVAELEAAAKLAPAANADGVSNHEAPAASVVPDVVRDMTDIIRGNATDDEKHAAVATLVEAVCPGWRLAPAASNSSAILTSSPAASGAAGTEANG